MAKEEKPEQPTPKRRRQIRWMLPLSLAVAGLGSTAAILLRGCWHSKMSWPTRVSAAAGGHHEDARYSYQVCMKCGIKRLFDEKSFRGFGPYGYDVHDLIARDRAERMKRLRKAERVAAKAEPQAKSPPGA
jgi:hypothetical protein